MRTRFLLATFALFALFVAPGGTLRAEDFTLAELGITLPLKGQWKQMPAEKVALINQVLAQRMPQYQIHYIAGFDRVDDSESQYGYQTNILIQKIDSVMSPSDFVKSFPGISQKVSDDTTDAFKDLDMKVQAGKTWVDQNLKCAILTSAGQFPGGAYEGRSYFCPLKSKTLGLHSYFVPELRKEVLEEVNSGIKNLKVEKSEQVSSGWWSSLKQLLGQ